MLFAALGVAVFAAYVNMTPAAQKVPPELRVQDKKPVVQSDAVTRPRTSGPAVEVEAAPELFVAKLDGDKLKLVPEKASVPQGQKPMVFALNETLKNIHAQGIKVLGVEVKDRVALLDFNPALVEGMGSMEEANLIEGLRLTLGQFKEIDKFQMRLDGEILEEVGGHDTYEAPLDVKRPGS
jgi:hypothetical protein